ncbi:unnamed protein product [Bursaphelenchus okinawaensis]|uniref:Ubiquinone biosynthesis monooxygenase COQ6, mitochondrial n=1 Tax=Bursaphelenchus okinawaensis TaxID=465554 RepID=A0A811L8X2_9BILA|nr:unnamed protein product [Bursaphelenchus okinawaensis]CAG9119558.1 unnamed protein product [Bursaphelenchus okinawaensis]
MFRRFSSAQKHLERQVDVAIVGGGPVGNALAVSISKNKWLKDKKVVVLEAGNPQRLATAPAHYSNRVFACNPASVRMFHELGIWETLKNYRVKEVGGLYVLDACSQSKVQFTPRIGENNVSHLIEDEAITKALYGKILDDCSNVDFMTKIRVNECRLPEDLRDPVELQLSDGSVIRSLLVVGADGARSGVRAAMGVNTTSFDYDQMAIVCTLEVQTNGVNDIAWQRFTPLGPIALLPLTNTLSSLVWTSKSNDAKRLLSLGPEEFVDELNHYLFTNNQQSDLANNALNLMDKAAQFLKFGEPESLKVPPTVKKLLVDSRASFPLGFAHSHTYVKTRAALIGDAAHRVHPLAGQGVNLGWSDVKVLTNTLEKAIREGSDIGSLTYLSEYDAQSQRHNLPVMVSVDWLNRLYRTSFAPLVMARSLGLHVVDKIGHLKDFIVSRASH